MKKLLAVVLVIAMLGMLIPQTVSVASSDDKVESWEMVCKTRLVVEKLENGSLLFDCAGRPPARDCHQKTLVGETDGGILVMCGIGGLR